MKLLCFTMYIHISTKTQCLHKYFHNFNSNFYKNFCWFSQSILFPFFFLSLLPKSNIDIIATKFNRPYFFPATNLFWFFFCFFVSINIENNFEVTSTRESLVSCWEKQPRKQQQKHINIYWLLATFRSCCWVLKLLVLFALVNKCKRFLFLFFVSITKGRDRDKLLAKCLGQKLNGNL